LHRLVKLDLEQHAARVESATPLSAGLQTDVANRIMKIYGAGADITFSQNPALIGGLRIQVGSDLYDGSVKTRLEKLEQSF
jgi:F-type H+-transporting ATPase subunit delta